MADASYSELVTATIKLNLTDFEAKMRAADATVDAFASDKDVKRTGSNIGFTQAGNELIDAAVDGMKKVINQIMADSLIEVPVDTTILYNSAAIEPEMRTNRSIGVTFGYGYGDEINPKTKRRAAQYALPVHEIYEASHEPLTKSHYLIDPLIEHARELGTEMGAEMRGTKLKGYRINRGVSLFRKGGGPGVNPVLDPTGKIVKRKRP